VTYTEAGRTEHKAPVLMIVVPKGITEKFPQLKEALTINQDRVITPYNVYATMKHLLTYPAKYQSKGTQDRSLFEEVEKMSCSELAIPQETCLCTPWIDLDLSSVGDLANKLATKVVDHNNHIVNKRYCVTGECYGCRQMKLGKVLKIQRKPTDIQANTTFYQLQFSIETDWDMVFEALVNHHQSTGEMSVHTVAQLSRYGERVEKCAAIIRKKGILEDRCDCGLVKAGLPHS
jgi:hypothetical protein